MLLRFLEKIIILYSKLIKAANLLQLGYPCQVLMYANQYRFEAFMVTVYSSVLKQPAVLKRLFCGIT